MNVRLSILLLVVLSLIGGAVFITRSLSTKEPKEKDTIFYKIALEDIASVYVIHNDDEMGYAFEDDQWVIKDGNSSPVFLEKWAGKTLLLSGPTTSREVAAEIDDPAKFGLDPPQTRVRIIDKSGFPLEFHLGDPTPEGGDWYARLTGVGSERLFTVAAIWAEVISGMAADLPYLPLRVNVDDLNGLFVTHQGKTVDYDFDDFQWVIEVETGDSIPVSLDKWEATAPLLAQPKYKGAQVEDIKDLAKYGLDPPRTIIQALDKNSRQREFHLGNPTDNGERWYAKLIVSEEIYTVSATYGEAMSNLVTEPPYPPGTEPPAEEAATTSR